MSILPRTGFGHTKNSFVRIKASLISVTWLAKDLPAGRFEIMQKNLRKIKSLIRQNLLGFNGQVSLQNHVQLLTYRGLLVHYFIYLWYNGAEERRRPKKQENTVDLYKIQKPGLSFVRRQPVTSPTIYAKALSTACNFLTLSPIVDAEISPGQGQWVRL